MDGRFLYACLVTTECAFSTYIALHFFHHRFACAPDILFSFYYRMAFPARARVILMVLPAACVTTDLPPSFHVYHYRMPQNNACPSHTHTAPPTAHPHHLHHATVPPFSPSPHLFPFCHPLCLLPLCTPHAHTTLARAHASPFPSPSHPHPLSVSFYFSTSLCPYMW